MATETPRLKAPYILSTQAQKEVTHNTALNRLDALVQTAVETASLATPPGSPAEGQLWLVATGATGNWAGHDNKLAQYIGGVWQFYTPFEGMTVWLKDSDLTARYGAAAWQSGVITASSITISGQQVVGSQQAAIGDATGGATVDGEARAALNALLAACRAHGLVAS